MLKQHKSRILEQIELAIEQRMKISLQMIDTPEFHFILFHPYAILTDLFDGPSVIGLVERHHTETAINYFARPKLKVITFVEVLKINFEPNHQLWKTLRLDIDAILQA